MTTNGFSLSSNGVFAVLEVGEAKARVLAATDSHLRIDHLPLDNDPAHAGVFCGNADALAVAIELAETAARNMTYAGRVTNESSQQRPVSMCRCRK